MWTEEYQGQHGSAMHLLQMALDGLPSGQMDEALRLVSAAKDRIQEG